ncbi:MmcQ/YjbR family DNA-binding protein [Nannocystis sp. SCPEA4]|uniref:MmcQ/YjbR family DNA-binding protein n=1 Tax=Nannocystis sp. SCPEA4 TaxID=2996787 RepID=UPI002271F56E|nr:MmcQ/YjbR family DNA-binding protein [Nannocystis sp. SCPEA4]MCY1060962.1 MmcQ/YjbR family DNA-binding protein [Nannocystis sp. SCPEA4]
MTKQAIGAGGEQLRALALAYPETVEEFPWGHTAVKVRGKAFLFMGGEPGTLSLSCKLPASHGAALLLPFASPTGYGLGKSGWVTAVFPIEAALPIALLAEWIDESYRAVAPKKLGALVEQGGPKGMAEGTGAKGQGPKGMAEGAGAARGKKAASAKAGAKKAARTTAAKASAKVGKASAKKVSGAKVGKASAKKASSAKVGKASAKKASSAKVGARTASVKKQAKAGAKKAAGRRGG